MGRGKSRKIKVVLSLRLDPEDVEVLEALAERGWNHAHVVSALLDRAMQRTRERSRPAQAYAVVVRGSAPPPPPPVPPLDLDELIAEIGLSAPSPRASARASREAWERECAAEYQRVTGERMPPRRKR